MEDHTLLTHIALQEREFADSSVTVVPLEEFLARHANAVSQALIDLEPVLRSNVPACPPLPEALQLHRDGGDQAASAPALARALRINPEYTPRLYLKVVPAATGRAPGVAAGNTTPGHAPDRTPRYTPPDPTRDLPFEELATHPFPYPYAHFIRLDAGATVTALEVIATAADEPDYGMDLGLFADNGTACGREYRFGRQPFGDPRHLPSTQAPFHMGFFHESPLLYRAAPGLRRSWPMLRVLQFSTLAEVAFREGCPYWGYRFAGWALHYVQDMTMPYHARAVPGRSTTGIIATGLLQRMGITAPYERMLTQLTTRHVYLESTVLHWMHNEYRLGDHPLTGALRPSGAPVSSGSTAPTSTSELIASTGSPAPTEPTSPRRSNSRRELVDLISLIDSCSRTAARLAPAADRAVARALTQSHARPRTLHEVALAMLRETGRATRKFTDWCTPPPPGPRAPGLRTEPPRLR